MTEMFRNLRLPPNVRQSILTRVKDCQSKSLFEIAKHRAEMYNSEIGHLTDYDCPECRNRGNFLLVTGDETHFWEEIVPCRCEITRKNLRMIKKSGLQPLLDRYTFETWDTPEEWQRYMKARAYSYACNPQGWFYIGGKPGTGKTHLCTAICERLMRNGYETRYVLWREFARQAKAVANEEEEYEALVNPVRTVPVLYMDDLFKTGRRRDPQSGAWQDMTPTAADINLAFDILGHRYNKGSDAITIISAELSVERLMEIDEAVAPRIYQNAKENSFDWSKMENWRLK